MTQLDLAEIGMYINIASLPLAIGAAYKIFIDKFAPPAIEHSATLCSRIRGGLAENLAECCRPFVETGGRKAVISVNLVGPDSRPLERSELSAASPVDTEAFKEAFQDFIHDETREFHDYWSAFVNKRRLQFVWAYVRSVVAVWGIVSFLGIGVLGGWKKEIIALPLWPLMEVTILVTVLPPALFVSALLPYAILSNQLAAVDE